MITAFDLMNAMNRSYGIDTSIENDTPSRSLMSRAIACIRAGSSAKRVK